MNDLYIIIFCAAIILIAAAIVVSVQKRSRAAIAEVEKEARQQNETAENYRGELVKYQTENAVLRERITLQNSQQVKLQEQIDAERIRLLNSFEEERQRSNKEFTLKFENLANEILDRKTKSMSDANRQSIGDMLKPFSESVEQFRRRIEEEAKQRFALENEVKRLAELNLKMSKEANDLTSALKGNSKYQGDWGEMILETLLENSGLVRDKHFRMQHSVRNEAGALLRPDVILSLPDRKEVVIDSKVSLNAYMSYCETDEEQARKKHLAAHTASVRNHIGELGSKNYSNFVNSPDFVIMFIPNEPAFLLALQGDSSIWHEAYSKGVILSSPTNLFAILRIVDDLWRRDTQSKNALEIARQGSDLYDKFVLFAQTFTEVGGAIRKSEELYEKGMGQFVHGRGSLVSRVERMRKLGIKASKEMPKSMTGAEDAEDLPMPDENMDGNETLVEVPESRFKEIPS